jgi:branched-chain amino acid transport system substrate-binding protein
MLHGLRLLIALTVGIWSLNAYCAQVVIAQIAPLTEKNPTARELNLGMRVYFDAVNDAGGIHGSSINFVSADRNLKASEATQQTKKVLTDAQPVMLVGLMGTGWMEALVKSHLLEEEKIPVVGIRTGAVSLHEPVHAYLYHTRASYRGEVEKVVTQLFTTGLNRIAILREDSPFGEEGLSLIVKAVSEKKGLEIVGQGTYAHNTSDVKRAVNEIYHSHPQCVIVVATSPAAAEFYKGLREVGSKAQVIALSVADGAEVVKLAGKEKARGLIFTQVVPDPTNRAIPLVRELHDNIKKYAPRDAPINHAVVEGYIAAKTAVEALKIAGPRPTRKTVKKALDSMKLFDAGGVVIAFSPQTHTGSKHVEMAITLASGKLMR